MLIPWDSTSAADFPRPKERPAIAQNYRQNEVNQASGVVAAGAVTVNDVCAEPIGFFNAGSFHAFLALSKAVLLDALDESAQRFATQLWALQDEDDDDVKATQYALGVVWRLFSAVSTELPAVLPDAAIYTDDDGGIRCEWRQTTRQVRLVVPAGQRGHHYIYYQEDSNYSVEDEVTPEALAGWLRWLIGSEPETRTAQG